MPLYEYLCRECDQEVEVLVRGQADHPECPACGSGNLTKLLSVCASPSSGAQEAPPEGPCGSACGCFPPG